MSDAGVKIGNVAEGAFVISLGLIIAENELSSNQVKPNLSNVKRLMKEFDPEKWVNGGVQTLQLYNGKATLKSKARLGGKHSTSDPNQVPPDTLEVNLAIQLNRGEVEPFYGQNANIKHKDWPKLDNIINQMLSTSNRYRSQIERVKQKYLSNTREEYIRVDIRAMGAEGAYSGGNVKGDVTLEVKITPVSLNGSTTGVGRPFRLPKMSYSLKASGQPPRTISNQGPIKTLMAFENKFGVNVINSRDSKKNPTIGNVRDGLFRYIENSVASELNFPELPKKRVDRKLHLVLEDSKKNEVYIPIGGMRKWDLLDGTKFPLLHPAKGNRNSWVRSWIINEYYDAFLEAFEETIPNGVLTGANAERAWSLFTDAAFGSDRAEIISFGESITKMSTLPYINKLRQAVDGQLYATRSGNNLEFHLPTKNNTGHGSKTKLYFVRYKNRTPGTFQGVKEFKTAGSVELKMMIEAGDMSYEPEGYTSNSTIEWDPEKKQRKMDGQYVK